MSWNKQAPDRNYLIEREKNDKTCLYIVSCFAVLFCVTCIVITSVAMMEIYDLTYQDAELNLQIGLLKEKIRSIKENYRLLEAKGKHLLEEMLGTVEKNRQRRQGIDIFSAMLQATEAVFEKLCVPHTAPCPKGPNGDNGTTGDIGLTGKAGVDGQPGSKGDPGDPGMPGFKGPMGSQGQKGDPGTKGFDGLPGDTGVWGNVGDPGVNGTAGLKGQMGDPGMKGDIGHTGQEGSSGLPGMNGTKGEPGDVGTSGINGTQGPQGPNGTDARKFADDCQCVSKPSFINPNDETISVGRSGSATLTCSAQGNPTPTISMSHPSYVGGRRRDVMTGTFPINQPRDADYGGYKCEARNVYGTVTKILHVVDPAAGK